MHVIAAADTPKKLLRLGIFLIILSYSTRCFAQSDTLKPEFHKTLEDQLSVKIDSTQQRDVADERYISY